MHTLPRPVWRKIMQDYLRRPDAPLSDADWDELDRSVAQVLAAARTVRRFLPLQTSLTPALQAIPTGARGLVRSGIELPIIHWDFTLSRPRHYSRPDLAPAMAAATTVALAEDHLVLNGHPQLGHRGLLQAADSLVHPLADLDGAGALLGKHSPAPLALVAAQNVVIPESAGRLCLAGLHVTPVLPPDAALLIACDAELMDLVVVQDAHTAYLGNDLYRVFELVALRIKEHVGICRLLPAL